MNRYEEEQLEAIIAWESKEPAIVGRLFDVATKPLVWLIGSVVPNKAIKGVLEGGAWLAESATDTTDIIRDAKINEICELQNKSLKLSDNLANDVHNWAIGVAAVQGGVSGALGLPGMAVGIPLLLTFALRIITKIGVCYGFEPDGEKSRQLMFTIMSLASANSVEEKTAAIIILRSLEIIIIKETWKATAKKAAQETMSRQAALITIKELAKQLGINITKRSALKAIPVIGGVAGAAFDSDYIRDIGWTARHVYQKIWLTGNYPDTFSEKFKKAS